MAKPRTTAAPKFSVDAWRAELDSSAISFTTAAAHILRLVLSARGIVEEDTAKEAIQHAFASAYAQTTGFSFDEACKAKSVQNRVSDAMAVFRAEVLPQALPGNLQQAASAVRKANPKAIRAPRQPVAKPESDDAGPELQVVKVDGSQVDPLTLLGLALEGLAKMAGDNPVAVSMISELKELATELGEAIQQEV